MSRNWKPFNLWERKQKTQKFVSNNSTDASNNSFAHVSTSNPHYFVLSIFYYGKLWWNVSPSYTCNVSLSIVQFMVRIKKKLSCVYFRLPYDWRPTFTYLGTYFLQGLSLSFFTITFYVTMFLHIGFCLYSFAFVSDLKFSLFELNAEIVSVFKRPETSRNTVKHKQKLYEIIRFHCDAEQLSNKAVPQIFE